MSAVMSDEPLSGQLDTDAGILKPAAD